MTVLSDLPGRAGRGTQLLTTHVLHLLGILGMLLGKTAGLALGRTRLPPRLLLLEVDRLGFGSLGVIVLSSATVGISLIFLSLEQLRSMGGLPLLAFFFSKGLLREIGPVIAGVVMAVRIASQVTSGIAAVPLEVREVAAKRGPEFDLTRHLLPAFLAVLLVAPVLFMVASFSGLFAGVVSQTRGSAEDFLVFSRMILDNFSTGDLQLGLLKSLLFGVTVVVVAGYFGFLTPPEPERIQKAIVSSIVVSAVLVLAINAAFALTYAHTPLKYQLQGL